MDDQTLEDLSAYLDGELDPAGRARVADLVATSEEARAILDRLAAGRELTRSAAVPAPTSAEAAALDAGVLSPMPGALTVGGPSGEGGQVAVAPRRPSPRRRGRPPWPYFAAAAALALVLSLGVAVLAQVLGRGTTREATAPATAATTPATKAPAPSAVEGEATATAPAAPTRPAAPLDRTSDPSSAAAGSAVPPAGTAQLYLSGVRVGDPAGLAALAGGTTPTGESRDEAITTLLGLAGASGTGLADLSTCLSAAGPGVPVRVDVGTFGTQPAYLVVLASPGEAGTTVTALARGTCAVLATVPVPP